MGSLWSGARIYSQLLEHSLLAYDWVIWSSTVRYSVVKWNERAAMQRSFEHHLHGWREYVSALHGSDWIRSSWYRSGSGCPGMD